LKTIQEDLLSLELYYIRDRSGKLLVTCQQPGFFGAHDWLYYQQKSKKYMKYKVQLGKSKNFRIKDYSCTVVTR